MMPVAIETAGYTRAPFTLHSRSADSIERLAGPRGPTPVFVPERGPVFRVCRRRA